MTKQLKGSIQVVGSNATSNGKNIVRSVNGLNFNSNGNLEIDSYTTEEFTKILSVLPISHYGSYNYLPAGVYGSYEGSSDVIAYRYRKLHVEDNGTMTMLRPGTNGSKRGLYYSFHDNILSSTALNKAINTNKEYKPGYFGSTYTAKSVIASDTRVTTGMAFDASNNGYIFISWMGGTLNDSQHVGSIVPASKLLPNGGSVMFVMTGNTEIYFFVNVSSNTNLELELRSVPISQVQSSSTNLTVTEYKNWTINGLDGNLASTNLLLIKLLTSKNAADKPYMLIPAATTNTNPYMGGPDIYAAQNSAGLIRMRVVGDAWCTTALRNTRPKHSYSFVLNPSTKVATLDSGSSIPLTITDTGSGTTLTASGNLISTDPITTLSGMRGNMIYSYYYFENGVVVSAFSQNQGSTIIQRAKYPNVTSVYDTLNVKQHTSTDYLNGEMNYQYGSPVSSLLMSLEWLPNNRYRIFSYGKNWTNSINEFKPGATYSFDSVSLGTIQGFEPTTNRYAISNSIDKRFFISTITGSNVTTNGGVFIENYKTESYVSYDQDLNGTGFMSIDNSLLTSFKKAQLALSTISLDTDNQSSMTLYVPQQTNIPAFAVITSVTATLTNYTRVVEVNVNTRTGNITTLTFKRLVHESSGNFGALAQPAAYGVQYCGVGLTIYDAGTFYFIAGADTYIYKTIGDSNAITWRGKVTKSTSQMDSFIPTSVYQNHVPSSGTLPFAAPGVGFGYINFLTNWQEDAVRMIFQPVGTTLAEYNAWADKGSQILLASQDVAQGFIIYFTEETSVLLSGKSFTMPVQNIDLTKVKANPANSTFYIYVVMDEGLAKYIASEEVIAETGTTAYNTFWIGTVTTNSNQIDKINIIKRSRLDVFGASLEAAGSSFPVSYGLPSGNGIINW